MNSIVENKRIIFLDIDGVLNCQVFYDRVDKGSQERVRNICNERVSWLNDLCEKIEADVVVSSTWRLGKTVEYLQKLLNDAGATFKVIDKTPDLRGEGCLRGNEIYLWLKKNRDYEFKNYVIIDDDSDMLLWQQNHFFKVDSYSGLTPNTCYKIKRFFGVNTYSKTDFLL